ncbi:reverse transcriptase domain-containing protein [Tanacetum coccineum]|uniref:Reverse transcriptase domain-containing protein n=1 Tax=Tanacetum coccineum TaxID=301880 RepID=A0ABQ5FGK1_9ASTR
MQFVVHNFDRMNAMYKAFTQKLKKTPALTSTDPSVIETWNSDSDDVPSAKTKENIFVESNNGDPSKSRAAAEPMLLTNAVKGRPMVTNDFYHEPFIFKETDKDVRDLVASPFTIRIRDYDMPDNIKVPTNLRTYDGMTDPDNHLIVFMGTMDVHKLSEPACLDDPILEHCTGDNPLIITAEVGTTQIHRIYVDRGSSTEIMYENCFEQLTTEEKKTMRPLTSPLVGIAGQVSWPLRLITLLITLYDYRGHISKTVIGDFMVAIELGEHEILYKPRSVVKGQILADFLAELPTITDPQEKSIADKPGKNTSPAWTLFTDGAANLEGSGVGLILTDPSGQEVTYALWFNFRTSNNKAEYEALVAGLELTIQMEA